MAAGVTAKHTTDTTPALSEELIRCVWIPTFLPQTGSAVHHWPTAATGGSHSQMTRWTELLQAWRENRKNSREKFIILSRN